MTPQQYLEQILAKYNLGDSEVEPLKKKRAIIEEYVRRDNVQNVKLVDPASTNNIVSDLVVSASRAGSALKIMEN